MKRASIVTAALAAAVAVLVGATLPPKRAALSASFADGTVAGVLHIHTNRSDGRGSPDEIAAAAARAGLAFIVLTDHGDATRVPDAPVYRHGVLCLDGVEISTSGGHYVAIGLPQAPYPLGGEPRDVVEDVARLGGVGVAAHPDSPKPELRWHDWTAPFDGLELVNPDTGWRKRVVEPGVRPKLRLIERLFSYPFRTGETIASVLADPAENLARWDSLTRARRVVGLAGADAHAKLALMSSEPGDNRFSLPVPGYEASFRAVSVHVQPGKRLTGQPAADAAAIIDGLRAGNLYIATDAFASPPAFNFTADQIITEGEERAVSPRGAMLHIASNAPSSFTAFVLQDGHVVASSREQAFDVPASAAGVYRVEVRATDRPGAPPWILSNPIYLRAATAAAPPPPSSSASSTPLLDMGALTPWRVEHDPASNGSIGNGEGAIAFAFMLGKSDITTRASVALVRELPDGLAGNTQVSFTAHADRPMRVSVQLRTGVAGTPEERWQRSVYLDTADRDVTVPFDDMRPVGDTRTRLPALDSIRYVLFVVDPTHTAPGSKGLVTFKTATIGH